MKIENIKFIDEGDYYFKVSFMYNDHNLETDSMPRSTPASEVAEEIKKVVNAWESKRATDNYETLKSEYEGKSVEL